VTRKSRLPSADSVSREPCPVVRIDVAATLHCRGLCPAERLGIADQHDGKRAGHEVPGERLALAGVSYT